MKKLRPYKWTNGTTLVTTLPLNSDEITIRLIYKYLKNVYPIFRMKSSGKFKRTINVDGSNYLVSSQKNIFTKIIINDLSKTFDVPHPESKSIVLNYFKIKH